MMGKCLSKEKRRDDHQFSSRSVSNLTNNNNNDIILTPNSLDETEIARLNEQLEKNTEIFILNQLLMSFCFYENFENERQKWNKPSEGDSITGNLLQERSEKLVPDVIFEQINNNLAFQRKHGEDKKKIEPLVPKRIVVITDNIEVVRNENNVYSEIDKPGCQVKCTDSTHDGFVKLKCVEAKRITHQQEVVVLEPQPGPSIQKDGEIYTYTTITDLNTPKPIRIVDVGERRDTLPKVCFTLQKNKNLLEPDSDEEEEEEYESDPAAKKELYIDETFINSAEFFKYFESNIFPHSVGEALGFTTEQIINAQPIPGKIFCHLTDENKIFTSIPCQIIPAVPMQWPSNSNSNYEFRNRTDRAKVFHLGQIYTFLTKDVIENKIEKTDCVLIPKGFYPKKETNAEACLEWEIAYPKAERFLDTSLSRTKIRAFLFIILLHKTYIEPETKNYGLLFEHVRTFMYWQYEAKPKEWPEHGLGQYILSLLAKFNDYLAIHKLPDFFYKKKNIFENIPNGRLEFAHEAFHNILESPVIYFIKALQNLKVIKSGFYPVLHLKKLYGLLTKKERAIHGNIKGPNDMVRIRPVSVSGQKEYRKEIDWERRKEEENKQKIIERRRKIEEIQKLKEQNLQQNQRKPSIESININARVRKLTTMQNIDLLKFFIRHFIEMAKSSRRLSTQQQALFYLKQAWYLAKVLFNHSKIDSKDLLAEIDHEQNRTTQIKPSDSFNSNKPPSTPQRNSIQFNYEREKRKSMESSRKSAVTFIQ